MLSIPTYTNGKEEEEVLGLFRNTVELPEFGFSYYISKMLYHYAEQVRWYSGGFLFSLPSLPAVSLANLTVLIYFTIIASWQNAFH